MAGRSDPGLRWLARRVSGDAFFLGKALAEYQAMHGIDDWSLAEMLQCTPVALARLALCRWPDDRGTGFREDVQRIAAFASCDAEGLVQLLREVAAAVSLREEGKGISSRGLLMAARDRRHGGGKRSKRSAGVDERRKGGSKK